MAEIYLARSLGIEGFEKHVVLKKILPQHAQKPAFVRMFLDEARLAAKLQHQNIAQVYDIGRLGDGYFFVMEYLHGRDLRSIKREHRARGARLPIHHALTIAAGVAAGLDYAHNASDGRGRPLGLVHRDVSPSNVVVTFDGAIKLVDFGIARAGDTPSETRSGALKGKVPYMSPEQCKGLSLDGRSDLFSLGITLYELTTGVSPFCKKGDTDYTVLQKIAIAEYQPPSEVVSSYPPEVEAIVIRALSVDRDDRYQTAREMLIDVERAAADLGVPLSATALADHLRNIYGDQPLPWADKLGLGPPPPTSPEFGLADDDDDDDDLLAKTIATGSVIEGVNVFEVHATPEPYASYSTPGHSTTPPTSVLPKRRFMWAGLTVLAAVAAFFLVARFADRSVASSGDLETATEPTTYSKPTTGPVSTESTAPDELLRPTNNSAEVLGATNPRAGANTENAAANSETGAFRKDVGLDPAQETTGSEATGSEPTGSESTGSENAVDPRKKRRDRRARRARRAAERKAANDAKKKEPGPKPAQARTSEIPLPTPKPVITPDPNKSKKPNLVDKKW